MPLVSSQKGTSKKGRDGRQQPRSRNSTPSLAGVSIAESSDQMDTVLTYLDLPVPAFRTSIVDELPELNGLSIPSSRELDAMMGRLQDLLNKAESRENICDRGMRKLAQIRKDRIDEVDIEWQEKERNETTRRDTDDEEGKAKPKKKDIKIKEERPPTHGAHGLAPQDGSGIVGAAAPKKGEDSTSSSLSPPAVENPDTDKTTAMVLDEDSEDEDERQPPPAPAITNHKLFGDDPSTFPDDAVYEIRQVTEDMTEEEIKEIYAVAQYPHDDLHDLIPGTPPDKDFSNAKPPNQTQANTFATYLEPYFRAFTEEDLAFLRERGDRVTPFIIPRRGKKHYTEIWAEEDGAMSLDRPTGGRDKYPANQARGSIEALDDATAESDLISLGPVTARVLSVLRPEHPREEHVNGDGINGDADEEKIETSATTMPGSDTDAWRKANHPRLDYAQVDERIKQELRHIGFLPPEVEPDFDAHYDDDVAARLRYLQTRLREVCVRNGARKARIMQVVEEHMAFQEYHTICEDLDNQVNQAYLKRTRTMGKSKKAKRPGGAGGGSHVIGTAVAIAKPGIGDSTKSLLDRKRRWENTTGPIFEDPRALTKVPRSRDPDSSIFKPSDLAELIKRERDTWDDEAEEE